MPQGRGSEFPSYEYKAKELTNLNEGHTKKIKDDILSKMKSPGVNFRHDIPSDTNQEVVNSVIKALTRSGWHAEWIKKTANDMRDLDSNYSYIQISPPKVKILKR